MDPKLYRAVASGNESSFDEFMMGSNPILLQKSTEVNTILHVAALNKQIKIAEKIIEFESCASLLYHQNSDKDTPLHIAARVGCSEILQLLINSVELAGTREIEAQQKATRILNDREDTALHVAVYYGHLNVVEILIHKDPGLLLFVNSVGDSPLFVAINRKMFKVAKFMLENSNECSLRGRDGMNALHAAVARLASGCHDNLPKDKIIEMIEVIKEMKNKFPSSILEEDDQGWTPLHYASKYGCVDVVEMFVSDDSSLVAYKKDKKWLSAFHVAAEIGYIEGMEMLIRHCPDIWELLSNNSQTALHVAVKGRNMNAIEYISSLSSWDVLLNRQDKDGNTPLHLPSLLENNTIIRFFSPWSPYILKKSYNQNAVVAALIATLTFTAAFQIPGGYENDGPYKGLPILRDKTLFYLFMLLDSVALGLSCLSILMYLYIPEATEGSKSAQLLYEPTFGP